MMKVSERGGFIRESVGSCRERAREREREREEEKKGEMRRKEMIKEQES